MNKYFLLTILFFSSSILFSQTNTGSPYSINELGEINFSGNVSNLSMGGIDVKVDSIEVNLNNPASYAKLKTSNYLVGTFFKLSSFSNTIANENISSSNINYIAVGSSSKINLGDDYYAQNFYDIITYKKCLDKGKFPIFRGMKLSKDDQIRQHVTQHIKSFLGMDFKYFEEKFKINPKEYFSKEIEYLGEMIKDGLVTVSDDGIKLTEIGEDFSQNIANVFDKYDPPSKSYTKRLATIQKAKLAQAKVQELI